MDKKLKYGVMAAAAASVAATGAYLCWPKRKVKSPDGTQQLEAEQFNNTIRYLSEDNYMETMHQVVEPYLMEHMTSGYIGGYDGRQLYYEQYLSKQHKAHIAIAHGYTDGCYKFRESVYYFLQAGYSVSIIDQRGHGYSYRQQEDLSKVTIGDFDEYVKDYRIFVKDKITPVMKDGEKLYMFAHSMGGCIAALLMEEDPELFDAAVLIAPMLEILYGGLPENTAMSITRAATLMGRSEKYILGRGAFDGTYDYEHSSISSEPRYAYLHDIQLYDRNYQTYGGTYAWLTAAVKAADKAVKNADRYSTPTLLFQAELDNTVGASGQNAFADRASNVRLIQVLGAKHSIQLSENPILIPFMDQVMDFYEEHLKN